MKKTPIGNSYTLYDSLLKEKHLLIAGSTGSGKSVVINGMMHSLMFDSFKDIRGGKQVILIDPKRVELSIYKKLPHCIEYASEPQGMIQALQKGMTIIEKRFKAMQAQGIRKYSGNGIYIFIDEFADLMTTNKKQTVPLIQRIAQIGRASNVHLVLATQTPIAKILPTEIKCNFDSRIALRTRSKQDSRNIIEQSGCETLPPYGYAFYMQPQKIDLIEVPMIEESELMRLINHWK